MRPLALSLVVVAIGAAHCARQAPAPAQVVDAGPPPVPTSLSVPAGLAITHIGDDEALRRLVHRTMPELGKLWRTGFLITGQLGKRRCSWVRVVAEITAIEPCAPAVSGDAGATKTRQLPLLPQRFGRILDAGVIPFDGVAEGGEISVPRALLDRLLAPLNLPDFESADPVKLTVHIGDGGASISIALAVLGDLRGRFGRFDLSRRYGAYRGYARDVRAWGDAAYFQWIVRLEGGGAGLRAKEGKLRVAMVAGSDWKTRLDALLRGAEGAWGPVAIPGHDDLILEAVVGRGLRLVAAEKPLPTAPLMRQLAPRMKRWNQDPAAPVVPAPKEAPK